MYTYAAFDSAILKRGPIRIGGGGLGNLLYPWARSIVAAEALGCCPIYPTWRQFKLGPYLRGERDRRHYRALFTVPAHYVSGLAKYYLLFSKPVHCFTTLCSVGGGFHDGDILGFTSGHEDFADLAGHSNLVLRELKILARESEFPPLIEDDHIAIHVRLGDFAEPDVEALRSGATNTKIPVSWYREVLEAVRSICGRSVPGLVYTGSPQNPALRELLKVNNVTLMSGNSAVYDLLAMQQAGLLIGSASTFSRWAAFLGKMPSIWFPGQRKDVKFTSGASIEYSGDRRSEKASLGTLLKRL